MSQEPARIAVIIPLPVYYNPDADGVLRPVEDEKFEETLSELAHWGGTLYRQASERTPAARGVWWDTGVVYKDDLAVLEVLVEDTDENRRWFREYAGDVLVARFQQKAMCVKYVGPVEMLVVYEENVT